MCEVRVNSFLQVVYSRYIVTDYRYKTSQMGSYRDKDYQMFTKQ